MWASERSLLAVGPARLWAFVRLGRPQFLLGGFALFALGAAIARAAGASMHWHAYWLGQTVVTSTQIMTNYSNDYFDFEADAANRTPTQWSGGSRVLPSGEIPRWVALWAALAAAALALTAMLVYAHRGASTTALWLMPLMLCLAWIYSAPPFRLHSRGVGELAAAAIVAVLVPWFGFVVHVGRLSRWAVLAVVPIALLQFAMLLCVEFPDRRGDEQVGKNTLVVRLGVGAARALHNLSVSLAYLLLPVLVFAGLPARVGWAVACTAPLALWQLWLMRGGGVDDVSRWEPIAFASVALVFASTLCELLAFASV